MGNTRLGVTLGVTMAVVVGCSDDDSPPVTPDVDAAVSSASTERPPDSTDSSGGEPSETSSEPSSPDTTAEGTESSASTGGTASSAPATNTGDLSSSVASGQPSGETSAPTPGDTDTSAPDTGDTGTDGAVSPPDDMIVIADFDTPAGFQDGQHNLDSAQVRTYADSLMTVEAAFTGTGQQTGVNFNHSADLCGYDVLARIRLRSGTIAAGGVQMRVWSDSWTQFASGSGNIGAVGEWVEYRVTWSDVVAANAALDINAINAVGFAFMTFGAATESVFDVDWIGLVPSATPCPSDSTDDTGSSTAAPDLDAGVVDTDEDDTTGGDASVDDPDASADASVDTTDEDTSGAAGEAIPLDLEAITEFNSAVGSVGAFSTTDDFESITPVVAGGIAKFNIPFDVVTDKFQWVIDLTPSPRDLTGAELVARVRVTGLTAPTHAPILQLYGLTAVAGTASYSPLPTDGSWAVVEYSLDTAGWGDYSPTEVTAVALEFHANEYDGTTDGDVGPAVVEIDWVGLRLAN